MSMDKDIRIAIETAVLKIANPNVKKSAVPANYISGTNDIYVGENALGVAVGDLVYSADLGNSNSLVTAVNTTTGIVETAGNFTASSAKAITLGAGVTVGNTSITITASPIAVPAGTTLSFLDTTIKTVVTKEAIEVGETAVDIYPAMVAIASGSVARYEGSKLGLWTVVGTGNGTLKSFSKTLPVVSGLGYKNGSYKVITVLTTSGAIGAEVLTADKSNNFVSNQSTQAMYATLVDGVLTVTFTVAPVANTKIVVDFILAATAYASYTDANNKQTSPGTFYFEFDSLSEDHKYLVEGSVTRQAKLSK